MPTNSLLTVVFCVLNAGVYWQQRAATFALYLIGVDIGDGLCAVVKVCSNVAYFTLPSRTLERHLVDWYMAKYLALSFRRAATCLNMLASLERFLAIAFPLKNISRRAFRKPLVIIAVVFLACLLSHSFMVLEYHAVLEEDGDWRLTATEWKRAYPGVFVVVGNVVVIMFAYAPLIVILVLNFLMLLMLRAHSSSLKNMRKSHGSSSEDTMYKTSIKSETTSQNPTKAERNSYIHDDSLCRNDNKTQSTPSRRISLQDNLNDTVSHPRDMIGKHYKNGQTGCDDGKLAQTSKKISSSKVHNDSSITKMVMVFTTVFFLLALPSMLSFTARHLFPEYSPEGRESNLYRTVSTLSMLISHLTEPSLFWVSFAYSRHFRRAVFRLPGARWCCGRSLAVTSVLSTSSSDVSSRSSRKTLSVSGAH
ncbi:hypothetical protein ACOMHN_034674 [Nucella lapillus]